MPSNPWIVGPSQWSSRDDMRFGAGDAARQGIPALREIVESIKPYHAHHTTNTTNTTNMILTPRPGGSVRAWSKYVIVRTDGTAGSGDYQDTLVSTEDGWRIAHRVASRGNRRRDDPGGPSSRTFTFKSWVG